MGKFLIGRTIAVIGIGIGLLTTSVFCVYVMIVIDRTEWAKVAITLVPGILAGIVMVAAITECVKQKWAEFTEECK